MFIEYKQGEKHAGKNAERSETMDSFQDCGQLLTDDDVVIDIDHLPKESIHKMIEMFNIKTMTVWTDRGAHLWFKKPVGFTRRRDGVCKLGFEIEQHTKSSNPYGMTVKRNGVPRQIDNPNLRMYMPDIFEVSAGRNKYKDMTGMAEGEGRNKALFTHRKMLNSCTNWEKMLQFVNNFVFAEPLPEDEYEGIVRTLPDNADVDDKYFIATNIMSECRTVIYAGSIWWMKEGEYITDDSNGRLIRLVFDKAPGQKTAYVDEIVKQIQYRSPIIDGDTVFPIRFRNGIIQNGEFFEVKNYNEFTPYFIDIDYKPDAPPIPIVDEYIEALTSGDQAYQQLLMEVIGYVMITDPERIRSLGKFFMFRGDGANGKGTLLQIMKKIYNPKNCTNLSIKQMTDDRFKVTMIGKLANLGDDIEPEAIDNDQLKVLKNISTADTVSTRKLYSESESATFTVKLYFTTNSDIRSFEKGYAYKRRIVWLPMFNKVDKPDPNFITKITTQEALEYWVRLIVEGYKRLYKNQQWTECEVVTDYNNAYHENNNAMLMVAKDLDPDVDIVGRTIKEIQRDYDDTWATDDRKFSSKSFREAVWDLYQIGIGTSKVDGKSKKVFMYQKDTKQKVMPGRQSDL